MPRGLTDEERRLIRKISWLKRELALAEYDLSLLEEKTDEV